jgi:hypothetical protein
MRIPMARNQGLISLVLILAGIYAAWKAGGWIASGDNDTLVYAALGFALIAIGLTIVRNWRMGFYMFIFWLMFEDLARKYMGNNMVIYFAKDVLVGLTYLSLFIAIRRGAAKSFRPAFLIPLTIFFWLGFLQVFNPYSPSILYGILGMKIYFYYVPLIFVGYALIRDDADLQRFLRICMILVGIIALMGIIQATISPHFLNPPDLAPDIRELGYLHKMAPVTNQIFLLPASIFVSAGRFAFFLILATNLGLGAVGYFTLSERRGRFMIYLSIATVAAAVLLSGSRSALLYSLLSGAILVVAFVWGTPWRSENSRAAFRTIRRSLVFAAFGVILLALLFPKEAGSRLAYYTQTLSPNSSAYQLSDRAWDYPMENLKDAFLEPHWAVGNGIGTASLGIQYVSKFLGQPPPAVWVEEGYGQLIVEMGILAPILWIIWTATLLWASWKIVRSLRRTRLFPLAAAILCYSFVLLYPLTYLGLDPYQNYVNNAFLWILVGILFRLPDIAANSPSFINDLGRAGKPAIIQLAR